jgi:RNA polymerase sigma-70 factor (ECF subfamily)
MSSGDQSAFAEFYDRHARCIFGLLTRLLRPRCEAEDALQETFWQVWRRADDYDPTRGSARLWLIMIARSRAMDRLRRLQRERPASCAAEFETDAAASDNAERGEAVRLARRALASLPSEQSGAISLAFYSGLSHGQIAKVQGVPLGTVKTRIRLGMRRLRELLLKEHVSA